MTVRRLLRPVKRWVAARLSAVYAEPTVPVRPTCEAFGGPCDGKRWRLPGAGAPIWLADDDGDHHLYVPTSRAGAAATVRYRYVVSAAKAVA